MSIDKRTIEKIMEAQKPSTRFMEVFPVIKFCRFREHSFTSSFDDYAGENMEIDLNWKQIAFRSSSMVASISIYRGDTRILACSGFTIECNLVNGMYRSLILSSGIVKVDDDSNCKIIVALSNGSLYEGKIVGANTHYNLSLLSIDCDNPTPIATIRCIDDSSDYKLSANEIIMPLGRYFAKPYRCMFAAGSFSFDSCDCDCEELLRIGCRISKSGIGGPVINRQGEVIGISFYASSFTPFLPINLAVKWWHNLKQNMVFRPPLLGIEAFCFSFADLGVLEEVHLKFPHIRKGIIVRKVKEGSTAYLAGVQSEDVIFECSGQTVDGFLQLLDLVWDKVGERVNLSLIRPKTGSTLNLSVIVDEPKEDSFNQWQLPKKIIISKTKYPARV